MKREYILKTADDIVKFIDKKHCIDVDIYHIAELINDNIGFLFEFNSDLIKEIQGYGKGNTK
jgi:hypothetical protein